MFLINDLSESMRLFNDAAKILLQKFSGSINKSIIDYKNIINSIVLVIFLRKCQVLNK